MPSREELMPEVTMDPMRVPGGGGAWGEGDGSDSEEEEEED